jgi:2-polyprenyl-3-methyl-5-hydroxy-6-metoxy-1,4-benzoquinol methylase
MGVNKCRACGGNFHKNSLLELNNMPKAAQHMPDKKSIRTDKGIHLEVKQCAACGLIQLDNEPVKYYRDVIRATSVSGEMKAFREKQFWSFIRKNGLSGKKILEIGCGKGDYLSIMDKAGVKALGIENNPASVDYCKKSGLKAIKGFVAGPSYKIKGAPFDGFFMMSFLEHLPDLRGVMAGIRNNLKDGACGLVEVPNFDMMLKKKLYAELIIDHLFYFTRNTLTTFLSNNGFEVIGCSAVWHDYILSTVVRKKVSVSMDDASAYFSELKMEINDYVDSFRKKGKSVAIWGAGHQAFMVMSVCGLKGKIEYVVDSAPFKQGKYTPATHIPIVGPETLVKKPVNAIIIMAGSYSREICGLISKKHKQVRDYVMLENSKLINGKNLK